MNSSLWYRFEIQSRESLFMFINIGGSFAPTSWLASFYCNMYGPGLSKTTDTISVRTAFTGPYSATKTGQQGILPGMFNIALCLAVSKCLVSSATPCTYGV